MSDTILRPDLDNTDMDTGGVCHSVCQRCDPVLYPGVKALCGVELLGIDPQWPGKCQDCEEQWKTHIHNWRQ